MKSMMRRPFEKRPVGWWKNVSPYGGNATLGRLLGSERPSKFPVSAMESPKLMIDLKFRQVVSELTTVSRKRVDKKKLRSFFIRGGESRDVMPRVLEVACSTSSLSSNKEPITRGQQQKGKAQLVNATTRWGEWTILVFYFHSSKFIIFVISFSSSFIF